MGFRARDGWSEIGSALHALARGIVGCVLSVLGRDLCHTGVSRGPVRDWSSGWVGWHFRLWRLVVDPRCGVCRLGARGGLPRRPVGVGRGRAATCWCARLPGAAPSEAVSAARCPFAAALAAGRGLVGPGSAKLSRSLAACRSASRSTSDRRVRRSFGRLACIAAGMAALRAQRACQSRSGCRWVQRDPTGVVSGAETGKR